LPRLWTIVIVSPLRLCFTLFCFFFFQAEDGIRARNVTGVQTCALPISLLLERAFDRFHGPIHTGAVTPRLGEQDTLFHDTIGRGRHGSRVLVRDTRATPAVFRRCDRAL